MPEADQMKVKCLHDRLVKISELKPHPKNRNKHSKGQIERFAKVLQYQGVRRPVRVSKLSGLMTVGHGMLEAAKVIGWKFLPVNFQDYESEEQELADLTADNALGHWSDLDMAGINADFIDMGPDFDIDLLGIKDFVLEPADKCAVDGENDVPDLNKTSPYSIGDVIELGSHRLMCGDSTNDSHVKKLMGGEIADICFTSPPYNLGDNAKLRGHNASGTDTVYTEKSDHKSQEQFLAFMMKWVAISLRISRYSFCNIQMLAGNKLAIPKFWMTFHDHLVDIVIWDKEHGAPAMAPQVLNSVWEFIFIFSPEKNPKRTIKSGQTFRGTKYNIFRLSPIGKKDELAKDHGAVFPVAFVEHFVENFSKKSVVDLFGGSGTTMIACEKMKRRCFMMELNPLYVAVIVERWERFTGNKAKRIVQSTNTRKGSKSEQ